MEVVVYTDASCSNPLNISACGFLAMHGTKSIRHEIVLWSGLRNSIVAEVYAIVHALHYCFLLKDIRNIVVYTEMDFIVRQQFNKKWHWDSPVFNELIDTLDEINNYNVSVEFVKVKAHSHDRLNNKIDNSVRKVLREYLKKEQPRWQQRHT